MKILFVAALHHPEQLAAAVAQTPAGEALPLFAPSVSQHFWERAFRRRGYAMQIFYRNLPASGTARAHHHREGLTPEKIVSALAQRIPPALNPELRRRNQSLLEQAQAFQPDILWMVGDNRVITAETLRAIKAATGCLIVYATGTSPIVFSGPVEREAAPLYDLVLVNDYYHGIQWLELGAQRMACLPLSAADPDFHHPYPGGEVSEVAFVGTLIPAHLYSRRVDSLAALTDFDLGIWSVHEAPAVLRPHVRGSALGESMLRVLSAARITVNAHGNFMHYGGNMRLFEAAGVGVLQITENLPGVREWFSPGENIVTYSDTADLRQKVRYYLDHEAEREAMVQRAQEHVYAHHSYEQRVDAFEALI
jgi:glycosyltransferase involved in cell wall biosynthesis